MIIPCSRSVLRHGQRHKRILGTSSFQQSAFARLLSSLAVLEQRDGKLQNASLSAITAAQKAGGSITGFVAGSGIKAVAEEAAKVKGLDKVIMVENGAYDKVESQRTAGDMIESDIYIGATRELCSFAC